MCADGHPRIIIACTLIEIEMHTGRAHLADTGAASIFFRIPPSTCEGWGDPSGKRVG